METVISPYDQKASKVNNAATFMAKKAGDYLVKLIIDGKKPRGNLLEWHNDQLIILDNFIKLVHEETKVFPNCKNKCSGCCKYPILATEVEYLHISQWIRKNITKETMDQLHKNVDQWYREMGDFLNSFEYGNNEKSIEYTLKNIKCPFLLKNSCSIYEARPVACRTYFSYGNPKNCEKESYPKGTLDLSNAKHNLYTVAIANKIKLTSNGNSDKEDSMFESAFCFLLLPLWFSKS